jgi:hypothetical protein
MADPRVAVPTRFFVRPSGRIAEVRLCRTMTHRAVDHDGNLRPGYRELGWCTLEEAYEADSKLGRAGYEAYLDHKRATRQDGMTGEFPDELLPAMVLQRREGAAKWNVWTPPKIGAAKPTKAKATKRRTANA